MSRAIVGGLVVLTFASLAAANADDPLANVIDQLDHDDHPRRTRAQRELMQSPHATLDRLTAALDNAASPESAHRLRGVLRHRLVRLMWRDFQPDDGASLGLSHADAPPHSVPGQNTHGVRVVNTIPGFPAHAHLRPGDVIVALEGHRVPSERAATAFTEAIKKHHAGQPMQLTLVRDGRRQTLTLTPAPLAALGRLLSERRPLTLGRPYLDQLSDAETRWLERDPTIEERSAPVDAEPILSPPRSPSD